VLARRRTLLALGATCIAVPASLLAAAPAEATFPATNGPIVFGADVGSGYQLYTVRPDGDGLRRITRVTGDAFNPDWSPDGRRIAFELDRPNGAGCAVMVVNADGSHPEDLTGTRNGCEAQPSFTPDGRHLVFERYDDRTNVDAIWRMDVHGGDRALITRGLGQGVTDPNVSPDGSTVSLVAFNGQDQGQALATVRAGGSGFKLLTPFATDVAIKQDWAPDGQRIALTDNADIFTASANIATVRPDAGGLRYLTHYTDPEVRAYVGSYSPDGNWIVFRLEDHGRFGLYRMHRDGSPVSILPLSSFRPRYIDWGPAPR
jgi:Tol biopolymer transport system component